MSTVSASHLQSSTGMDLIPANNTLVYNQNVPSLFTGHDNESTSSVTDVSAGVYNVNFGNRYANTTYSVAATASENVGLGIGGNFVGIREGAGVPALRTTTAVGLETVNNSDDTRVDRLYNCILIIGQVYPFTNLLTYNT